MRCEECKAEATAPATAWRGLRVDLAEEGDALELCVLLPRLRRARVRSPSRSSRRPTTLLVRQPAAHLSSLTLHGDRHQSDDHVPRVWARDGGDDGNGRVPLLLHVPGLLFAAATIAR